MSDKPAIRVFIFSPSDIRIELLVAERIVYRRDREFADLYGAFPVKRLFWVALTVFCSERERPFFVPSPAIRFAERAEGVKGPKR